MCTAARLHSKHHAASLMLDNTAISRRQYNHDSTVVVDYHPPLFTLLSIACWLHDLCDELKSRDQNAECHNRRQKNFGWKIEGNRKRGETAVDLVNQLTQLPRNTQWRKLFAALFCFCNLRRYIIRWILGIRRRNDKKKCFTYTIVSSNSTSRPHAGGRTTNTCNL